MIVGKIYSTLGNNNSLVPLAIKDIANSMGLTAGSYITGDTLEGKDRFIDEFGTQAIWLFGIPVYKKILDLILFKPMNFDPKIDVRVLKNKEILKKATKFASTQAIKNGLETVTKEQKMFKGLTLGKFALSTGLTALTYFSLTKFRHKYTEEQIKKDYYKQKRKENFSYQIPFSSSFDNVHKSQPTFTGGLQEFMFNPVKNLMIVDATITGERLTHARNKQDFIGYTVKEGGFWTFMYFAGEKIQKALENHAEKKYNKSIDLDARVIESDELKTALKSDIIQQDLQKFPLDKSDAEIYEFINTNSENIVVKMSKKSDIITTYKKTDKIDTRKYIDIDDIKSTAKKLEKLDNQYKQSGETLENFLTKVRKLKRGAVLKNIGSCIGALGVVVPTIMVVLRLLKKDKDFQTKKDVIARLAAQN